MKVTATVVITESDCDHIHMYMYVCFNHVHYDLFVTSSGKMGLMAQYILLPMEFTNIRLCFSMTSELIGCFLPVDQLDF